MPFELSNLTLAVLAGGAGLRMGRPKAELTIEGRPILEFLLDRWSWPGATMVVTAPGRERPPGVDRFDREVVDPVAGQGPLRGVLTAIESVTTPLLVVTTVDMPGIERRHLEWIADRFDRVGVMTSRIVDGTIQIEPFPLVVRADAINLVRRRLIDGRRSVFGLSTEPGFTVVPAPADWPRSVWTNLNSVEDLHQFGAGCNHPGGSPTTTNQTPDEYVRG